LPQQPNISVENNFKLGLKTEFTGLNFPENASTDTDNCVFSYIGEVSRRLGIDFEENFELVNIDRNLSAVTYFKWLNAGGDGLHPLVVLQAGEFLYFYSIADSTNTSPLSQHRLSATVSLTTFIPSGGTSPFNQECQFAEGNGYLFVFHPTLDPFYCTYSTGSVITATPITVKIRDFEGIVESGLDTTRPTGVTDIHRYNLANQGWGKFWADPSGTANSATIGLHSWVLSSANNPVNVGDMVTGISVSPSTTIVGTVVSYVGTTLNVQVTSVTGSGTSSTWTIRPYPFKIEVWNTAVGNYPANSDVWWNYKNASNVFDPATTIANVTVNAGPAPKGFYILDAFRQDRATAGQVPGLAVVSTLVRPKTGSWFAGRVWYAGVDATSFSENIYFSQIVLNPTQFGKCYQINDPTSEDRFALLPSDGGVLRIQGAGVIYKLFPVQNGLLVFASNGIWFITGSQGVGFTANDYTIVQLSKVRSISGTSFVDVLGWPTWWNEEGIYNITPNQPGGLNVNSLTVGTIGSFYADIPLTAKRYARGDYDPLNYVVQWTYRDAEATTTTQRYEFNRVMNFNTATSAFYPWTISLITNGPTINGVCYVPGLGGMNIPPSAMKFITSSLTTGPSWEFTFSEARDEDYQDFASNLAIDYTSYFVTGYKISGKAATRFQVPYVYLYLNSATSQQYKIQGRWDFSARGTSGRWSTFEVAGVDSADFNKFVKRHRIRGRGLALQIKVQSMSTKAFNIMGWAMFEAINQNA